MCDIETFRRFLAPIRIYPFKLQQYNGEILMWREKIFLPSILTPYPSLKLVLVYRSEFCPTQGYESDLARAMGLYHEFWRLLIALTANSEDTYKVVYGHQSQPRSASKKYAKICKNYAQYGKICKIYARHMQDICTICKKICTICK